MEWNPSKWGWKLTLTLVLVCGTVPQVLGGRRDDAPVAGCLCPPKLGKFWPPFVVCGNELNKYNRNDECIENAKYFCLYRDLRNATARPPDRIVECKSDQYCGMQPNDSICIKRPINRESCISFKTARHCFPDRNDKFKEASLAQMESDDFKIFQTIDTDSFGVFDK